MSNIFWLHLKKCRGTSFRESYSPPYIQTDRKNPRPFISIPKSEWNDALNNFALPLGEYDNKRMLFAQKFLYSEEDFKAFIKFAIVRNPYDRAVSSWKYLTKNTKIFSRKSISNPSAVLMKYNFIYFLKYVEKEIVNKSNIHFYTHILPIW